MVVIAIIAILAAVAVPLLVRDTAEGDFEKGFNTIARVIQRAKYEALSNREDRALIITPDATDPDTLQLEAHPVGATTGAVVHRTEMPRDVKIAGILMGAQVNAGNTPNTSCTTMTIRYSAVNDVMVTGNCSVALGTCNAINCDSALCSCSVTLFVESANHNHRARIVIYQATGFARRLEKW
jgi:type II secretory pathway pseudopilin PulG